MSILDQTGSRQRRGRAAQARASQDHPAYPTSPVRSHTSHRWDRLVLAGTVSGGCLFWAAATATGSNLAPGLWATMGVLCGLLVTGYGLKAAELLARLGAKAYDVRITAQERLADAS